MNEARLRLDKWLVHARMTRTRERAQGLIAAGAVRVNRAPADKSAQSVKPGDILTILIGTQVRVLKILGLGVRRGPPAEAQTLYEELPPAES